LIKGRIEKRKSLSSLIVSGFPVNSPILEMLILYFRYERVDGEHKERQSLDSNAKVATSNTDW
jgi:hypothetical protein